MEITLRSRARGWLDRWRARQGRANLLAGNRILVLGYHRVLPIELAQRLRVQPGMFVTPETLRMQLSLLREHVDFIHLSDQVVNDMGPITHARTKCVVTFDDGWRDNFDFAFPILQELECPATIFLATGYVGTTRKFWPERISGLFGNTDILIGNAAALEIMTDLLGKSGSASRSLKSLGSNDVIEILKQQNDDQSICEKLDAIDRLIDDDSLPDDPSSEFLEWDQVRSMSESGLVRFGSHTVDHLRLSERVAESRVIEELVRSKQHIGEMGGQDTDVFCYPNGEYSDAVVELVRQHYSVACTTNRGWVASGDDRLLLSRILLSEVGSNQAHSFLARLS